MPAPPARSRQFFFDSDAYPAFPSIAPRAAGITVPIVPGILPITNFTRAIEFSASCGASDPGLDGRRCSPAWTTTPTRATWWRPRSRPSSAASCMRKACKNFHFYTLNRADLTVGICHMLGVRPKQPAEATPS